MEEAESAAEGAVGGDSAEGAARGACAGEVFWGGHAEEDLRQGVVWDLRPQQFPFFIGGHQELAAGGRAASRREPSGRRVFLGVKPNFIHEIPHVVGYI